MGRNLNSGLAIAGLIAAGVNAVAAPPQQASIDPKTLPRIATIDDRFQSYNIEMVEVTGGRFWKPYDSAAQPEQPGANQPAGMSASLYQYRPPIDLSNPRLRKLAAALGPAYLRVSGTWANTTWFQTSDAPPPSTPPPGFKGILTRAEWKGVVDFANSADAKIVTSFAVSDGVRDASGVWAPAQAESLLAYTRSVGGGIAAAEFMNEPTFPQIGGAPRSYDAAAFARDVKLFRAFLKKASPETLLLGPGGVGEDSLLGLGTMQTLPSDKILEATGPVFDAFSYHTYGAVSSRCARAGMPGATSADAALTPDWLRRGLRSEEFYRALRDRFTPGKPMWLTETAQAACGGDRWASTFLDSFRYLNQLGSLARSGLQVHMHNTLAASDYGLLDENTYTPRPDYWSALLWRRLMGSTVLDAGASPSPHVYLYAHCLRNRSGGVSLLVINADSNHSASLVLPSASERYTLTAPELEGTQVLLNGSELKLTSDDSLPALTGTSAAAGKLEFAPQSITFVAMPSANNAACH